MDNILFLIINLKLIINSVIEIGRPLCITKEKSLISTFLIGKQSYKKILYLSRISYYGKVFLQEPLYVTDRNLGGPISDFTTEMEPPW